MPIYEFKCHVDGFRFETQATFDEIDNLKPECERCGRYMCRVFNPAGVVFKGSGFYRTDSRPPEPKPKEKKKDKKEKTTKKVSDGKT